MNVWLAHLLDPSVDMHPEGAPMHVQLCLLHFALSKAAKACAVVVVLVVALCSAHFTRAFVSDL